MNALWIALAGGAGSLARYGVGLASQRLVPAARLPVGTLAVNLIGCFLIGALITTFDARQVDTRVRLAVVTGFLGGFTTYSAFAYETIALAEQRSPAVAALYTAVTLVGCAAACAAGVFLVRRALP